MPSDIEISELSKLDSQIVLDDIESHLSFDVADPIFIPHSFISTVTNNGHPRRHHKLPRRYLDLYPEVPAPLPILEPSSLSARVLPRIILHVKDTICTTLNSFRLMREYPHRPSYDPDCQLSPNELSNVLPPSSTVNSSPIGSNSPDPPWPFANMSIYRLMHWFNSGSHKKSAGETERLVREVICAEDFNTQDLAGFTIHSQNKILGASEKQTPYGGDDWMESAVEIRLPTGVKRSESEGESFTVPGLHHRSLLSVLKSAIVDPCTASRLHFSPFKRFWVKPSGLKVRCIDEVYTSDAHIDAHNELQKQPNEPGCTLEKIILVLMFWSDSTQLANFGTAKVWPLYLFLGNLSKYFCSKPGSGACHHVAYIPSVSPTIRFFKSFY